jgi:hypothetical protein
MNSKDPFIVKVFEASSCHITQQDDKLLKRDDLSALAVYDIKAGKVRYGYLIYTGLEDNNAVEELKDFTKEAIAKDGYSTALINLLELAKKNGCKFLQLDCDGVEYEDLPRFNW